MKSLLPNRLNRRSLLAGLAASSAIAVTSSETAEAETENPRLLELAAALPAVSETQIAARDRKNTAYRVAMNEWPDVPEGIAITARDSGPFSAHDLERDVAGSGRNPSLEGPTKHVKSAQYLKGRIESLEHELATKAVKKKPKRAAACGRMIAEDKPLVSMAETYEEECARIKSKHHYEALAKTNAEAVDALHAHVDAIMSEPSQTMAGVVIKAQALAAWGEVGRFQRAFNLQGTNWADAMASAVLDQGAINEA